MIDFILSRQGCSLFSLHRSVSVMLLNFVIVPMFFSSMFPPAKTNLSMRNATRPFLLDMEHGIFLSSHSAMFLLPGFNIPLNNLEVTFGKSFLMVVSVLNGVSTVDIIFLLMTILADVFFIEYSTTLFVWQPSFQSWRWVVVSFVLILIVAFCASFCSPR